MTDWLGQRQCPGLPPRLGSEQPGAISSREHGNDKAGLSFFLLGFLNVQVTCQVLLGGCRTIIAPFKDSG